MAKSKQAVVPDWIDFPKLGNVDPSFELGRRKLVRRCRLVTEKPQVVLKRYEIVRTDHQSDAVLAGRASEFVRGEFETGRISPELGLGFTVVSQGYLNVALWSKEEPVIPLNHVYEIRGINEGFEPISIDEEGAFCLWEMRIADAEGKEWQRYLTSGRTDTDKLAYVLSKPKVNFSLS